MSRLRFEPRPFCAWAQHANHSDTKTHVPVCILKNVNSRHPVGICAPILYMVPCTHTDPQPNSLVIGSAIFAQLTDRDRASASVAMGHTVYLVVFQWCGGRAVGEQLQDQFRVAGRRGSHQLVGRRQHAASAASRHHHSLHITSLCTHTAIVDIRLRPSLLLSHVCGAMCCHLASHYDTTLLCIEYC